MKPRLTKQNIREAQWLCQQESELPNWRSFWFPLTVNSRNRYLKQKSQTHTSSGGYKGKLWVPHTWSVRECLHEWDLVHYTGVVVVFVGVSLVWQGPGILLALKGLGHLLYREMESLGTALDPQWSWVRVASSLPVALLGDAKPSDPALDEKPRQLTEDTGADSSTVSEASTQV